MVRNRRILRSDQRPQNSKSAPPAGAIQKLPQHHPHACRRFVLKGLALALLFPSFQPLAAQQKLLPVFHFNRLTTAEGLPSNEIRSNVVRDRQGFIWFGTVDGLVRYDGYSCTVYRNQPGNPHSLSSNSVITLHVDRKGRLWVGTYATGLSLYDPSKDRFVNFLPRRADSLWFQGHYVGYIMEDGAGPLWIGFADGQAVRLDLGSALDDTHPDSVARHAKFLSINDSAFKGWVEKVVPWDRKSVLVSSGGGLFLVDRETGAVSRPRLPHVAGLDLDTIPLPVLYPESPQKLWIGTITHGLYLLDRVSGSVTGYHKGPIGGSRSRDGRIQELQLDGKGRMWIATGDGIDLFDPVSGEYKEFLPNGQAPGKSMFTRMSVDSTGVFWISTADDGLYFLPPASFRFAHYALRGPSGWPMEMETIDRWEDGSYWIGTEGKVANIRLEDLSVLRVVDLFKGEKSRYARTGVWASLNERNETLWYGAWGLGLYRFDVQRGRVRNFRFSDQPAGQALKQDVCMGILRKTGDTLWLAGYNDGLLAFDIRTQRFSKVPDVSMAQPRHLMRDVRGRIWISDEFLGLFVLDSSTGKSEFFEHDPNDPGSLSSSNPQATYQDSRGRIWIACKELNLWEPEKKRFRVFSNSTFPDALIAYPLGNDSSGRPWVRYLDKGLSVLDPGTGIFANYDYSDGACVPINMTTLRDGRAVLVGYGGMNIVHPDSLLTPGRTPPFVFTKVSINDTTNLPLEKVYAGSTLEMPHYKNVLEFGFAAIDPGGVHLIRYFFKLEGLEDSWVESRERRSVRYPGLAHGNYVFRVKAINTFGRWPDQEIAIAVSISPPWWQTWWFRGSLALMVMGMFYGFNRYRISRLLALERVRLRIADDLHDDIGSELSSIALESELIARQLPAGTPQQTRLFNLGRLVRSAADNLRDVVWVVNPELGRFPDLLDRIRGVAEKMLAGHHFTLDIPGNAPPHPLDMEFRRHVLMIFKEMLNNVVRHARAANVRIFVEVKGKQIRLCVKDDGIGFDTTVKSSGRGLAGMRSRAAAIKGILTLESAQPSGTTICLEADIIHSDD